MIPVKVGRVSLSNVGFLVLLQAEAEDKRALPVFIGPAEAQAIELQVKDVKVPRPLTHDLMKNLLDCVEWRLKRIEVCGLIDNTFYGKLVLEHDGMETEVDSRPSDAIALALRCHAPIYVADDVMDQAGIVLPEEVAKPKAHPEKGKEPTPAEALKHQIEKAVAEERYEDAAKLRDELKRIEKHVQGN